MAQSVTNTFDYKNLTPGFDYKALLEQTEKLDLQEEALDEYSKKNATDQSQMIKTARDVADTAHDYLSDFQKEYSQPTYTSQPNYDALHKETRPHYDCIKKKIERLEKRINELEESTAPRETRTVFPIIVSQFPPNPHTGGVPAFVLEKIPAPIPQNLTDLQIIDKLSTMLREEQPGGVDRITPAEKIFLRLSPEVQKVFRVAHWFVHGQKNENLISQSNYGEIPFNGATFTTLGEKTSAVELAKIPAMLMEITNAFKKGNEPEAYRIFHALPEQVKNEIYGKHWEMMGKPSGHSNFGKVSFLGEEGYKASSEQRANTLSAYLPDFWNKISTIQDNVAKIKTAWFRIDKGDWRGEQKNNSKLDSLHEFAKRTVPLFLATEGVSRPGTSGKSYQALAEAYAVTYPFLRPFMFQLVPSLKIRNGG